MQTMFISCHYMNYPRRMVAGRAVPRKEYTLSCHPGMTGISPRNVMARKSERVKSCVIYIDNPNNWTHYWDEGFLSDVVVRCMRRDSPLDVINKRNFSAWH